MSKRIGGYYLKRLFRRGNQRFISTVNNRSYIIRNTVSVGRYQNPFGINLGCSNSTLSNSLIYNSARQRTSIARFDFGHDYYADLELSNVKEPSKLTKSQIKDAYLRMIKKWHPDQNKSLSHTEAVIKLDEISKAYELLGNTDQTMREKYDIARNYVKYRSLQSQQNMFAHLENNTFNFNNKKYENESSIEYNNFKNQMKAKQALFNYHGKLFNKGRNGIGFETQTEKEKRENDNKEYTILFAMFSGFSYVSLMGIMFIIQYFANQTNAGNILTSFYYNNNNNTKNVALTKMTEEDKLAIESIIQMSQQEQIMSNKK